MKIDMIGHATIFVETQDCKILMDPVLWDPSCEGLNESCPKREVIPEKLPEFDFLVISHQHLDHFDIRSLAYLPKKVDVLIPRDKLIEDCLCQLMFNGGEYHYIKGKSEDAKMLIDNRESLDFIPVKLGKKQVDSNPENYSLEDMRQLIEEKVCFALPQFIRDNRTSIFSEHCQWQVIYQLEIAFPDGEQIWNIDFSEETIQIQPGRNPLANLFSYITALTFYSLIHRKRDWDYLLCSGEYRTFHKIYSITREGINSAETTTIAAPIQLQFPSTYIAGNNVYENLAKWVSSSQNLSESEDEASMMCLGNLLIKRKKQKQSS